MTDEASEELPISEPASKSRFRWLRTTPFWVRLLTSFLLVFFFGLLLRMQSVILLSLLVSLLALLSIIWAGFAAFKRTSQAAPTQRRPASPRYARLLLFFIAGPIASVIVLATGSALSVALVPYTQEELQEMAADRAREEQAKAAAAAQKKAQKDAEALESAANSDEPKKLSELQRLTKGVQSVYPECTFEKLTVPSGKRIVGESPEHLRTWTTIWLTKDTEWDSLEDLDIKFSHGKNNTFYVCNSAGRKISEVNLEADLGYPDLQATTGLVSCQIQEYGPVEDAINILQTCSQFSDSLSQSGVWVVIRKMPTASSATELVEDLTWENLESGYTGVPRAASGKYAFTFWGHLGDFNQATIDAIDSSWNQIVKVTKAKQSSALVEDAVDTFGSGYGRGSSRELVAEGYAWLDTKNACTNELSVSDLSYTPGQCGMLSVEVFQSDANTGGCLMLGKYIDANGNSKTGLFSYCSVFGEGGLVEGKSYKLKVRVEGITSYVTRLGYENAVLSFTAIK